MKAMCLGLWLAGAALTAWAATNAGEPPEFRVYGLQFADGSNAADVVRSVVGPDGKVFFDATTHRLMVLADSNRQATVAQMVRQIDVAPRNVRIDVRFRRHETGERHGTSVTGQGTMVVDNSGGRSSVRIRPRMEQTSSEANALTVQQLLVASGKQASLSVGEDVPYIDWLMEYGRRYRYVEERLAWQRVGAYLVVEPTIVGDGPLIRVRLTPELSGLVDGHPLRTRFANVATEVTVSDGIPFALGGLSNQNDFYSRFLVGADRSGARQTLDIELTAYIVSPAGIGN